MLLQCYVLLCFSDAGIDDAQLLTLTREDLNEIFPGIKNFQLRRKIMELITDMKDSHQPGPDTFASALNYLIQRSNSNDAAVQVVLRESLRAFKDIEEQLKVAQTSLKPYIDVLNSLMEASIKKEDWSVEAASSGRPFPFEPSVRVHPIVCRQTFGADKQILEQLKGITESSISDCELILVFCPVVSRVGTDIKEALMKIPANKKAILVVMHHTFNPEFVGPSSNAASSSANIVKHVQVFFHDTAKGLLKCPANDHAVNQIQSVLHQYMGTSMS
ncbi:uncharacterized protein LOC127410015 isoform X2 [Myxocyprinus asiaticus]|uniref:uncharacterized protein LOC127410015 isoform X2 n=1 Tax=Myxocyprinus asiaticus TaxID=70543 RepID=UPI0022227FBC|nr:uncharacterized protein LOC127410015 isoform X2 [Myxocyprinus asiaticus]